MSLYLWKLSQNVNNDYDTYDSAVVVAPDSMCAAEVHPARYSDDGTAIYRWDRRQAMWLDEALGYHAVDSSWCDPEQVSVVRIGVADDNLKWGDVVCSSYNAG